MKKLILLFTLLSTFGFSQTKLSLSQIQYAPGSGYIPYTDATGKQTYTLLSTVSPTSGLQASTTSLTINGTTKIFTSTPIFKVGTVKSNTLTTNYIPKALSGDSLGNSSMYEFLNTLYLRGDGTNSFLNFLGNASTVVGNIQTNMAGARFIVESKNGNDLQLTNVNATVFLGQNNIEFNKGGSTVAEITTGQTLKLPLLTASTVPYLDASKNVVSSTVTPTELNLLGGVTGSLVTTTGTQTLTNKSLTSPTLTGTTTLTGVINHSMSASAASSSTVNLAALTGNYVHITGTVTITSFGTVQAGAERCIVFDGSLTLTNSANLILQYGANIVTQPNDIAVFRSEGSGVWRMTSYTETVATGTWSPSWTGFSVNPTTVYARYTLRGNVCTVWFKATTGTSNATTKTLTLPFAALDADVRSLQSIINNGANNGGLIQTAVGSNVLTAYATIAAGVWTASGGATVYLDGFSYIIQ